MASGVTEEGEVAIESPQEKRDGEGETPREGGRGGESKQLKECFHFETKPNQTKPNTLRVEHSGES